MFKTIRKIFVPCSWFLVLAYASVCAYFYVRQDAILFPAVKTAADFQYTFPIPFEEVWIEADGAKLHGLYFPAQTGPDIAAKGLIIFFHGNTERAQQFGDSAQEFTALGYDYFIPDYRGYGKSTGKLTSEAQFLNDSERIYAWAREKHPEEKIVLAGRSLGSVPAVYLASRHHPRRTVMIAAFYDIAAMKDIRYPFLPDFLLKYDMPNYRWLDEARGPVYLVHGAEDRSVPQEHSLRLAHSGKTPRRHFSVPGAGHSDLQDFPVYHQILHHLLELDEPA